MPESAASGFVFAGGEFVASLFDEHSLEEHLGNLDAKNQVRVDSLCHFTYSNGRFSFLVMPDRISIDFSTLRKSESPSGNKTGNPVDTAIIPKELTAAAKSVVSVLEPYAERKAVRVSGVGINCNLIFNQQEIGLSGLEFCGSRLINPESRDLLGAESEVAPSARFKFDTGKIHLDVRMEPHFDSEGQNLFVAVNGHQGVVEEDSLSNKLLAVEDVEMYVAKLRSRILASSRKN